jgi:hypothetical protein
MRRAIILLTMMAATILPAAGVASTQPPEGAGADRYVVVLNDDVADPGQVANGMA